MLNTRPILYPHFKEWGLILYQLKNINMTDLKIDQIGGAYQQIWQLHSNELLSKGHKRNNAVVWLEFDLDKIIFDRDPHPKDNYFPEDSNLSLDAQYKVNLLQEIRVMNLFDFMCEKWMKYVKVSADSELVQDWIKQLALDYHQNPLNVRTSPLRHVVMDRCDPDLFSEKLIVEKELDMFEIEDFIQNC